MRFHYVIIYEKIDDSLTETWKSKKYSINEIIELNYNLDQCGFPTKEDIILSPQETMNKFISEREQLEKELDEKLKNILQMIGDIK